MHTPGAAAPAEERFRLLVDSVQDYAIFMLDPQGHVLTWNKGAARLKGYAADEIIGRSFEVFYPGSAVATGWPQEELRLAIANGRFEDEGWRVRKDGSHFWANVVITPLRGPDGALRGLRQGHARPHRAAAPRGGSCGAAKSSSGCCSSR